MKAQQIITDFKSVITAKDPSLMDKIQVLAANAQMEIHDIHSRAIACHCECLGMNAEDTIAACAGTTIPYSDADYKSAMFRWGLVDESNKPII